MNAYEVQTTRNRKAYRLIIIADSSANALFALRDEGYDTPDVMPHRIDGDAVIIAKEAE